MVSYLKSLMLVGAMLALPSFAVGQDTVDVPDSRYTFNFNTSRAMPEDYLSRLMELFKMGRYGMDPLDMQGCNRPNLKSISEKAELPNDIALKLKQQMMGLDGEALWRLINDVAVWNSDLLPAPALQLSSNGLNSTEEMAALFEKQNAVITHLVVEAARLGHIDALNEVGASQLYCYNATRQDIPAAIHALERASQNGDPLAKMSLGKIYSSGLGGHLNVEKGHKLEDEAFDFYVDDLRKVRANKIK